eukprot:665963_1
MRNNGGKLLAQIRAKLNVLYIKGSNFNQIQEKLKKKSVGIAQSTKYNASNLSAKCNKTQIKAKLNVLSHDPHLKHMQDEFKKKSVRMTRSLKHNASNRSNSWNLKNTLKMDSKHWMQNNFKRTQNIKSIAKSLYVSNFKYDRNRTSEKARKMLGNILSGGSNSKKAIKHNAQSSSPTQTKPTAVTQTAESSHASNGIIAPKTSGFKSKVKTGIFALCLGYGLTLGFIATCSNTSNNNNVRPGSSIWNNLSVEQKIVAIGCGVGFGAVALIATPSVLSVIGFTSAGVAKGSVAAFIHSKIGCIAGGSLFAMAQSAGATAKIGAATKVATPIIGGFIGSFWNDRTSA